MSYRILTKNGVDNTNIDGARNYNFNAGRRSGIVKGALNQGNFFVSSSGSNVGHTVILDTCELRLCGHRVVIDEATYWSFHDLPQTPQRYSLIAQVIVDNSENVTFDLFLQSVDTPLIQDNLDKTGTGTYQLEIGRYTQQTDGTITDVVRTADLITGGISDYNGGAINIGNVTTNTLESGMEAEVDVEERFEPEDKKTYTDFTFSIPKGDQGIQGEKGDKGIQGVQGEKGEKGDKGDTGATPVITATATTLPAGSSATVTKSGTAENPNFEFGIPKGDKGDTGASAGFGTPTATIDSNVGTPSVTVTASGSNTSKVFNFAFKNLKGEKGDKGDTGATGQTGPQGIQGPQGPAGTIDVDSEMSSTSENPVQNKVLYAPVNFAESERQKSLTNGAIVHEKDVLNKTYPAGSIYVSTKNTSPASLFGGTWETIRGRFLFAESSIISAGSTGGEETHTLTIDEMPSHTHQNYIGGTSGGSTSSLNTSRIDTNTPNWFTVSTSTGNSQSHNNMPPYLAVYMWKRIA